VTAAFVALGAAIGAPTRYLIDLLVQSRRSSVLPWGTIVVNATGSLIIGAVAGASTGWDVGTTTTALISTGFCGALTTFSTFSFETVRLIEEQRLTEAMVNTFLSLVLTLTFCFGGYAAAAYLAT
jgi:CrcB protein